MRMILTGKHFINKMVNNMAHGKVEKTNKQRGKKIIENQ